MKEIENHYLGGKDKAEATAVPSIGSHIQTRRLRLERIVQERKRKRGISTRRQNDKLEIKDIVNPLGSFDPKGSLLQDLSILLILLPGQYKKGQH